MRSSSPISRQFEHEFRVQPRASALYGHLKALQAGQERRLVATRLLQQSREVAKVFEHMFEMYADHCRKQGREVTRQALEHGVSERSALFASLSSPFLDPASRHPFAVHQTSLANHLKTLPRAPRFL